MTKVGWIGLGKLGLPCALALAEYGGHDVTGYDVSRLPRRIVEGLTPPMQEIGIEKVLGTKRFGFAGIPGVVSDADIIFVTVQTPHVPEYGGEIPAPGIRRDFEYAFLVQACRDVCEEAVRQKKFITLVVSSTVLPGTTNRLIRPLLNDYVTIVYSPQFIAMGTTIQDFRNPEFVIAGADHTRDTDILAEVFQPLHGKNKLYITTIETAEAIKIFYNVFISTKIVFANTIMEICHKTGADCDEVTEALSLATDRVISPAYLRGGMGDGGACHPRDLIALSWLSEHLDLSWDLPGALVTAREQQAQWLARLALQYKKQTMLPVTVLGHAYKPGSDLTAGSPASLLLHYLQMMDAVSTKQLDPYVTGLPLEPLRSPRVFVIATKHPEFTKVQFPAGSVVLDPFGCIRDQSGVTVIRIGRKT